MKTFHEFAQEQSPNKIVVSKSHDTVFRDGGSLGYYVKNPEECGFQLLVQDFSIGSKRNGTEGSWYVRRPAPNHIEKYPVDVQRVAFV